MQTLPDDLFQHDVQTFPTEDPKIVELKRKAAEQEKKRQKQDELERERERKKEAAQVKKVMQQHGVEAEPAKRVTRGKKTAAPPSADEMEAKAAKRRHLMAQKIRLYWDKLGHKLQGNPPKSLPKSEEQLSDMLADIESQLCSNGGIEQAGALYINGCMAVEKISTMFDIGFDLSGPAVSFSATVAHNKKEWADLVTEVAISNAEWFMVGPGKRLIATTIQMMMACSNANRAGVAMARGAQPAPEKMKEEAEDL